MPPASKVTRRQLQPLHNLWIVVRLYEVNDGDYLDATLSRRRREAIAKFCTTWKSYQGEWRKAYRNGWRVVRVSLVPEMSQPQ